MPTSIASRRTRSPARAGARGQRSDCRPAQTIADEVNPMIARIALSIALGTCVLAVAMPAQGPNSQDPNPPDAPERTPDNARKKSDDDLAAAYFKIADYDGDGWIVYSEAVKSLRIDRQALAVDDVDHDGRISPDAIARRYRSTLLGVGAFAPPIAKLDPKKTARRTPKELLDAFDRDKDLTLDLDEVQRALDEYGARGGNPKAIFETLDKNRS